MSRLHLAGPDGQIATCTSERAARSIASVDCWRSYHCRTRYSVSLCDENGEEIRCDSGDDDMETAWERACELADEHVVEARLMPRESGEVTRTHEPEARS